MELPNNLKSWQSATITDSLPEVVDPPHFLNAQEGWLELVTNGGPGAGSESVDIFHSTDGGETWSKIANTDNPSSGLSRSGIKSGISFEDSMNGWATGGDYSNSPWLYVTHDGGNTWQRQLLPDYPGFIGTPSTHLQYTTTPRSSSAQPGSCLYRWWGNSTGDRRPPCMVSCCM